MPKATIVDLPQRQFDDRLTRALALRDEIDDLISWLTELSPRSDRLRVVPRQ